MDITLPSNVTFHFFCCTSSRTTKLNPTNLTQIAVLMFTFVFLRRINTVPQKLALKEQRTNIKMRTKKKCIFFPKPTFIECNSKRCIFRYKMETKAVGTLHNEALWIWAEQTDTHEQNTDVKAVQCSLQLFSSCSSPSRTFTKVICNIYGTWFSCPTTT